MKFVVKVEDVRYVSVSRHVQITQCLNVLHLQQHILNICSLTINSSIVNACLDEHDKIVAKNV